MKSKIINNKNGYVAILVCLAMPVIIAVLGICIDGSMLLYYNAEISKAVKLTAMSGASALSNMPELSDTDMQEGNYETLAGLDFIQEILKSNMEQADIITYHVDIQKRECTVKAGFNVEFAFMKVFGNNGKEITAEYTAKAAD